jgi:hypothetical protein
MATWKKIYFSRDSPGIPTNSAKRPSISLTLLDPFGVVETCGGKEQTALLLFQTFIPSK